MDHYPARERPLSERKLVRTKRNSANRCRGSSTPKYDIRRIAGSRNAKQMKVAYCGEPPEAVEQAGQRSTTIYKRAFYTDHTFVVVYRKRWIELTIPGLRIRQAGGNQVIEREFAIHLSSTSKNMTCPEFYDRNLNQSDSNEGYHSPHYARPDAVRESQHKGLIAKTQPNAAIIAIDPLKEGPTREGPQITRKPSGAWKVITVPVTA
ncbi:hypothetical protein BU15DRAFT_66430 [Melanogaster broomeanus]|nr:hypothetical protein BU15DRAFT_66430 [Melanogaster broomeanus]